MNAAHSIAVGRMARQLLIIYGCGGLGREVALAARAGAEFEPIGFLDDGVEPGRQVHGLPVLGGFAALAEQSGEVGLYVAIGDRAAHRATVERVRALGPRFTFPNVVHPQATADPGWLSMGSGNYVAAGARLTADVRIGDFNVVNLNAVVAHDVVVGTGCQINPGAVLNGQVVLGDEVGIGAGAVLMPRIKVGDRAVVGIGAVVGGDVPAGCTVIGNPARVVRRPEVEAT